MSQETKHVSLRWTGGLRFEGGEPGGPVARVDGDNGTAPGPMLTLLLAAASCSASDVVIILEKMRVKLREVRVEVDGARRETEPRRYVALHLVYHIVGDGVDETKARRAIDLSIEKYCSVMHSLAPDIPITYDLRLG
jgi:putative redox protein